MNHPGFAYGLIQRGGSAPVQRKYPQELRELRERAARFVAEEMAEHAKLSVNAVTRRTGPPKSVAGGPRDEHVDADAALAQLGGLVAGEHLDGALGGGVGCVARSGKTRQPVETLRTPSAVAHEGVGAPGSAATAP